jgi:diphthine-ammonia ligase
VFGCATWEGYETEFKRVVGGLHERGITAGVFGDIDLQAHLDWISRVCAECGLRWHEPLWQYDRRRVVEEFVGAGFRAIIVSCDQAKMGEEFLGKELTLELADRLTSSGMDAAGENGEYHTFVFDGPIFSAPVTYRPAAREAHDDYLFLMLE